MCVCVCACAGVCVCVCVCEPPVCQGLQFLRLQGDRGDLQSSVQRSSLQDLRISSLISWTYLHFQNNGRHGHWIVQLVANFCGRFYMSGRHSHVHTCQCCFVAETCQYSSVAETCPLFSVLLFPQYMWQEVSQGLSLNPLKILLLCVDED